MLFQNYPYPTVVLLRLFLRLFLLFFWAKSSSSSSTQARSQQSFDPFSYFPSKQDPMGKKVKWSWSSAFVGAATATAMTAVLSAKPRDPTFHLISINLTSFKLNFPVLDADLILTVHVTNPNIAAVQYSSANMSISYAGSLLGSARVDAGSQPPRSCQLLNLPARLSGLELAHHAKQFLSDVARREMVLDAAVDIEGEAKVLWWDHKFRVHVDSHVTVDPVFLDVIDQNNKSEMMLFGA